MAHWKRLTDMKDTKVDVNMDAVAYIRPIGEKTHLVMIGGQSDEGRMLSISVKETPDEIHMGKALRSM